MNSNNDRAVAKERWNFFAGTPMRLAEALRSALPMTEDHYTHTVGYTQRDPRAFFLYGCMDEVYKSSTASLQWAEFLNAPEGELRAYDEEAAKDIRVRHMRRVVTDRVLDEQDMWSRKLTEILTDLILFDSTNEQDYYRIYLGCRWLNAYLGLQSDFKEFYGCRNLNADFSIKEALRDIEAAQERVDTAKLWFLNAPISSKKIPRPGTMFRSARERYKQAVLVATADQKLTLGVSYEMGHSVPSRAIHPSVGAPTRDVDRTTVDVNIGKISLLATHTVFAAFKVSVVEPTGEARRMMDTFAESDAEKAFQEVHQSDVQIGDLVAAYGDNVCEVIEKTQSEYGYMSYKVRFLLRPMLEEIPVDWYPANYVHLLMPRRRLRESLEEVLRRVGASPEELQRVAGFPEERISELLPEVLRDMEAAGLFHALRQRNLKQSPPPCDKEDPGGTPSGAVGHD